MDKFLTNPWVGAIGTLGTIAGILLSLYIFRKGKYISQPRSRSTVLPLIGPYNSKSPFNSTSGELNVSYDNVNESEVSKIYVAIWNAGRRTIKWDESFISDEPLRVSLPAGSHILGTPTVLKETRPSIHVKTIVDPNSREYIDVSFKFLDYRDGAIIEFLCGGPAKGYAITGSLMSSEPLKNRGPLMLRFKKNFRERYIRALIYGFSINSGIEPAAVWIGGFFVWFESVLLTINILDALPEWLGFVAILVLYPVFLFFVLNFLYALSEEWIQGVAIAPVRDLPPLLRHIPIPDGPKPMTGTSWFKRLLSDIRYIRNARSNLKP